MNSLMGYESPEKLAAAFNLTIGQIMLEEGILQCELLTRHFSAAILLEIDIFAA